MILSLNHIYFCHLSLFVSMLLCSIYMYHYTMFICYSVLKLYSLSLVVIQCYPGGGVIILPNTLYI